MNENKRVGSIARRIGRAWALKLLRSFILLDIVVALLAVGGFCYAAQEARGGFDRGHTQSISFPEPRDPRDVLQGAVYAFTDAAGTEYVLPMRDFVRVAEKMFAILFWIEGALVLCQLLFGSGGAKRLIKPLNKIAATAQRLSEAPPDRGQEKIHSLENAIGSLAPDGPELRLRTGDRDLKGLEDAINSLLGRMQDANREKARFVSDASHELRTPISVIQGYASMLDRWGKEDPEILAESIAAIKSESAHMKTLVEQLLFLARGDSGRQQLNLTEFDLSELMQEVYEESRMIDEKHDWRFQAAENPLFCRGDADLIKQVARILTDNAAKYTPPGGTIAISAGLSEGVPSFCVQDSGDGIPRDALPRIFERFYRADPSREGKSGGTGLGLSIAKWIVEKHGGYFEVTSREGLGSRFRVSLPPMAEATRSESAL